MFEGPDTLNVPLGLQQLLDVVVQEVLLDVLVSGHQLHVVNLNSMEDEAVFVISYLWLGRLPSLCILTLGLPVSHIAADSVVHHLVF